jgi:hypothetical protein
MQIANGKRAKTEFCPSACRILGTGQNAVDQNAICILNCARVLRMDEGDANAAQRVLSATARTVGRTDQRDGICDRDQPQTELRNLSLDAKPLRVTARSAGLGVDLRGAQLQALWWREAPVLALVARSAGTGTSGAER